MAPRKPTNVELLTRQTRRKKVAAGARPEIMFDDKARLEYLSGFEGRNKTRREKKMEKIRSFEKDLSRERRRKKRQHLAAALQTLMQDIREQEKPPATKKEMTLVDTAECAVKTTIVVEPM